MTEEPPPVALLVFLDAAARHLSFKKAAQELCVTPSAVSQRIAELEDRLRLKLFVRGARSLKLTPPGELYANVAAEVIERHRSGFADLKRVFGHAALRINVAPFVAHNVLIPRIGEFHRLHPEVDLRIETSMQAVDMRRELVDATIRFGDGEWEGVTSRHLVDAVVSPACSPAFAQRLHRWTAADVFRGPLITIDPDLSDWNRFGAAIGYQGPPHSETIRASSHLEASGCLRRRCSSMRLSYGWLMSRLPVVLLAAALGLAATSMLPTPLQAKGGVTEIVFASGSDDTGVVQRLVDAFNASNRGSIHVTWRDMGPESDAHRRQLVKELSSAKGGIDLIASDVIWTAEFAKKGWVEDLTRRFYRDFERESFLTPALESATYRLRIWGVPWYTDAGLLFYRKDKLAQSGFAAPPTTWKELARMARKVMKDTGTRYGFVFQGAEYEGGTANAAEYIWSAGGELMIGQVTVTGAVLPGVAETDSVQVGSDAAARGLDIARRMVADKVSPPAVTSFREKEALDVFVAGDAVFLRSWPYVYASLRQAGFTPDQFGVAPLPAASAGGRSASCLGGWNLMINASSSKSERDAAWKLIRYLAAPAQQKRQAREAGLLPILRVLYDDPDLVKEVPVIGLGKKVLTSQLHARPISPFYSEMSAKIARAFNQTLKGELSGAEAARVLDKELREIVRRNR